MVRPLALLSLSLAFGAVGVACGQHGPHGDRTGAAASPSTFASASATPPPAPSTSSAAAPVDAGPYDGPWLGATVLSAPIMSEMEWPGDKHPDADGHSVRLGYMRYGEKAAVIPEPHTKPNCPDGWYELISGGFVCGKYATLDLDHPRFKLAKPPDLDGPLPYIYGVNIQNGTPLYRSVPSRRERVRLEPWLVARRKPRVVVNDDNPYSTAPDAGTSGMIASTTIGENAGLGIVPDAGAEIPWWQREAPDGGPPPVTLDELTESGGPIARRMVKGFYLSLDHQFDAAGTSWWKTVGNMSAPFDRIVVQKPITDFHGVWLGQDDATFATKDVPARRIDKLPVGFVLHFTKKWLLDAAHKQLSLGPNSTPMNRFDAVGLTGAKERVGGVEYWETDEGWWLRSLDATRTEPGPTPERLGEHDKWIDVNLKTQTLVAFEGTTPVFVTLVSSGRNEHETPPGVFRIREKHIAATMDADTAADGPYSIEDVPYIQYFNGSYALHGAFWHATFGNVKSHGCVNLAPWDAKSLFGWTDPQLPPGWHAAFATKERPGTRVIVHEMAVGTCQGPLAEPPQCPNVR
ncbi:MAG TPA: L,D-transpeptidase [Polyangiaceae bacterium]|nr:L,D-transpeptidase [Polyangiaceae bacterium]